MFHSVATLTQRPCPLCGKTAGEALHRQRFVLPSEHLLAEGYEVVTCAHCGLVYADTGVTQEGYDEFYARHSKYEDHKTGTGSGETWWDLIRLKQVARRIANRVSDPTARLVDIGCANGGLLQCLQELGYIHLVGVDPSPQCAANTRRLGVPAYATSIFNLPTELEPADGVVLAHVLEHLYAVTPALQRVRDLLRPGGILYVEVPDASRYQEFVFAPYQDFNTEHINHFSPSLLSQLLLLNGFEELEQGRAEILSAPGKPYPVVWGIYQRSAELTEITLTPDFTLRAAIQAYLERSRTLMNAIERKLSQICQGPVLVWGTGQLTLKLLAETTLGRAEIVAFVDNNAATWGKTLRGVPIVAPIMLVQQGWTYPIVIATILHQEAIMVQACQLGLTNELVTLQEVDF